MNIEKIVKQLKAERDRLESAILALVGIGSDEAKPRRVRRSKGRVGRPSKASRKGGRRRLTAEGRKRLSDNMKKRWAERKKKLKAA